MLSVPMIRIVIVFAAICGIAFSCREQDPPHSGSSAKDTAAVSAPRKEVDLDSLMDRICTMQDSARDNPTKSTLVPILITAAFDTNTGSFNVVGKGTANKAMPEGTWLPGRRTAAKSDALRWALYLKSWRTGNMIRFGQKIAGEVMYSKQLHARDDGDTTYVLLQIPVGSIDVR